MKKALKVIIFILCLLQADLMSQAAPKLSTVEIVGEKYYVYETKKGDSMFGISRQFGWDDAILQRLNPSAVSPLPKGMKIYYPVTENRATTIPSDGIGSLEMTPLKHLVKRGETVYQISRIYNIPIEKIYKLNPSSRKGIKEGELLTLNESTGELLPDAPVYYTVKKGDTLFGLARARNTTVAAIMKQNPGISASNFKAGDVIKLPAEGTGVKMVTEKVESKNLESFSTYKAEKNDTWSTISDKTGTDEDDLRAANQGITIPKKNAIIAVPEVHVDTVEREVPSEDPREATSEGITEIYEDIHNITDADQQQSVRIALLLTEPSSRRDLEFTRGFLTGVDKLKHSDGKINIKVMDATRNSSDLLTELEAFAPNLIFTSTEKNLPSYLAEYSEISQTPMVNVFDVKDETYTKNPYVIQLLTPSAYFNDEVAGYIFDRYGEYELVFYGDEESDQLGTSLSGMWDRKKVLNLTKEGMLNKDFGDGTIKYILYGNVTSKGDISSMLEAVAEVKQKYPLADISVLGRPNWIVHDTTLEEEFHNADVLIPSRFYFDKSESSSKSFISMYKSLYGHGPIKSFPLYAAVGYDCAVYFIEEMLDKSNDINSFGHSTSSVQSDIQLNRISNWSGLINPCVYLVRYTPYNSIEKIVVRK